MVECTPCKAAAILGVSAAVCRKTSVEPPKCDELIKDYVENRKTLVEVLNSMRDLVVGEAKKIIDKIIVEATK